MARRHNRAIGRRCRFPATGPTDFGGSAKHDDLLILSVIIRKGAVVANPQALIRGKIDLITEQLHVTITKDEVQARGVGCRTCILVRAIGVFEGRPRTERAMSMSLPCRQLALSAGTIPNPYYSNTRDQGTSPLHRTRCSDRPRWLPGPTWLMIPETPLKLLVGFVLSSINGTRPSRQLALAIHIHVVQVGKVAAHSLDVGPVPEIIASCVDRVVGLADRGWRCRVASLLVLALHERIGNRFAAGGADQHWDGRRHAFGYFAVLVAPESPLPELWTMSMPK